MPRRVKDYIEISDYTSLDTLIRYLETIRDTLPQECEPELKVRGDGLSGQRLTISFFRELTVEDEAREPRYSGADLPAPDVSIERLRARLDQVPYEEGGEAAT